MKTATMRVVLAVLVCASCWIAVGQDASAPTIAQHFRIVLLRSTKATVQGPVKLTIRLVNDTDTTVVMPKPVLYCGNDDGYVMVRQKLLSPAKNPEAGSACAGDRFRQVERDILAEAEESWVSLAPAASYEMPVELMFANHGALYEIRAVYIPPRFTEEELRELITHRIDVIQTRAESAPMILKSPH